jgi:hypothetical protein
MTQETMEWMQYVGQDFHTYCCCRLGMLELVEQPCYISSLLDLPQHSITHDFLPPKIG